MKDVEKNPGDFEIRNSFELNLTFDYEDGMKNVFDEKKIVLQNPIFKTEDSKTYIEFLAEVKDEDVKENEQYAHHYSVTIE